MVYEHAAQEASLDGLARHSIRHCLRAATGSSHARVDRAFGTLALGCTEEYATFLTTTAKAVLPIERALVAGGVERLVPDWQARSRTLALQADVAVFSPETAEIATQIDFPSEAQILGAMYVLEGSRLGAEILLRRVQGNADPRVRSATRYLSHGAGHRLWQSFLMVLESSPSVRAAPDEAIAGATRVFDVFEWALRGREAEPASDRRSRLG